MDIVTIDQPGSDLKTIPFPDSGEASAVSSNSPSMPQVGKVKIPKRGRGRPRKTMIINLSTLETVQIA